MRNVAFRDTNADKAWRFVGLGEVVGVFGRRRSEKCSKRLVTDHLAAEIADVFQNSAVLEI